MSVCLKNCFQKSNSEALVGKIIMSNLWLKSERTFGRKTHLVEVKIMDVLLTSERCECRAGSNGTEASTSRFVDDILQYVLC